MIPDGLLLIFSLIWYPTKQQYGGVYFSCLDHPLSHQLSFPGWFFIAGMLYSSPFLECLPSSGVTSKFIQQIRSLLLPHVPLALMRTGLQPRMSLMIP